MLAYLLLVEGKVLEKEKKSAACSARHFPKPSAEEPCCTLLALLGLQNVTQHNQIQVSINGRLHLDESGKFFTRVFRLGPGGLSCHLLRSDPVPVDGLDKTLVDGFYERCQSLSLAGPVSKYMEIILRLEIRFNCSLGIQVSCFHRFLSTAKKTRSWEAGFERGGECYLRWAWQINLCHGNVPPTCKEVAHH